MGRPAADNPKHIDYRCASDFGLSSDQLPESVLKTLKVLQQAGYKAYVVGGCIRDLLIGIKPKDFDIATDAHPKQIVKHFRRCRIIGRRFKLVHVRYRSELLEVSTFRSSLNSKNMADFRIGRRGMVLQDNRYGCLDDDILRRDFTVNALYYDPFGNSLVAHIDSVSDLEQRRIRAIGDAEQRYCEDPVRMLRAVRFRAKTGFTLDKDTEQHIRSSARNLRDVSPARLFEEVVKLFHNGKALKSYRLLRHYGLFRFLFPFVHGRLAGDEGQPYRSLLERMFSDTDQRIAENKSITPAFMMAMMIWIPAWIATQRHIKADEHPKDVLCYAVDQAIMDQRRYVAAPRHFERISRKICLLQPGFFSRNEEQIYAMLEEGHFRAAYDLLCLFAKAGFVSSETANWWTEVQAADEHAREKMIRRRAME